MKMRTLMLFCFAAVSVSTVAAQSRTITNANLDKYRQERVRAETDLRENYARLGFPSPEEIARRNAESEQQLIEVADRLRTARLERERLDIERDRLAVERERIQADRENALIMAQAAADQASSGYFGDGFFPGFSGGFGDGFRFRGNRGFRRTQEGYFAGGQFWPTGPRTAPRPIRAAPRPMLGPRH